MMHFLRFNWNPSEGIDLGFLTLHYYSLMFMVAFIVGWFIMKAIYKNEGESLQKLDSLFIYMVVAILIGARLGHVIFYEPELFKKDFLSVFLPFETKPEFKFTGFRGLASHGAAIAIIIAMFIYNKKVLKKPILWIFDRIIIPVAIGGVFVRFGNFLNSEIIGHPTGTDYGVVFQKLGEDFPRHPAQLYEAIGYIFVFLILWYIYWKTEKRKLLGYIFGLFLILLWTVRFVAEFFKASQDGFADKAGAIFSTGQWLSIPFIIAGIYLMVSAAKRKYHEA